jgi:NAD(P)-dependent dehydrogenase (short-subunit alcohol dehydrogenase family)
MSVVLVTGGTRGIGLAIADAFAAQGDTVAVCARRPAEGVAHAFFPADLREPESCEALIASVMATFGRLDVLVNNAGGSPAADAATMSPRFSDKIVKLNLMAPFWLSQQANAVMQTQDDGGVIVNIASVSGIRASPGTSAYGAAKAGLLSLTKTLAVEWAPKVRVTAVTPGLIATEYAKDHYPDFDAIAATVPAGRFGTPEDVANATVFLASPAAAYASGTSLVLDGGGEWPAFLRPKG